ncbi:MAG: metalloregulator ArsR/SmtB family transcription factor [Desulfobacterales bacterium]|jgi:DNA-binding transcriptional ArsR family regulator
MNITKALADENRVRILMALNGRTELCVCQLIDMLKLAPSTVSKHLFILRNARLINCRKKGRWMYYRLNTDGVSSIVPSALEWVIRSVDEDPSIHQDDERLSEILSEPAEKVNPLVVEVMKEEGLGLSEKKPQSVFELIKAGKLYDHVITVCYDSESRCPIFPGITKRWHWPFSDSAKAEGSQEEKVAKVREIRNQIKDWLLKPGEGTFSFKALIEK